MSLSRDEVAELFERRRQAWLSGDLDGYLACWTDDMEILTPTRAEPLRGKAAYADLARRALEQGRPLRLDFHHLALDGDVVLCEFTGAGERPDGTRFSWDGMGRGRLRDGLIAEWREYWNPADLGR
jgi:ketosteroid isomerase-like protein